MNPIKIIPMNEIYTLDFELTSFFAQRQKWIDGVLFKREKCRESSAFIYLNGCTGTYTDLITNEAFYAPCKSLVYLPYGSRYTVLNVESKISTPDAYLVEFNIKFDNEFIALSSKPFIVSFVNSFYIEKLMRETVDCYETIPNSPALLKSKIFDMLALVSRGKNNQKEKIYNAILPVLEYINKYPYDSATVEFYAEMCHLSDGGFRRLFKQYLGKSPREYIIDLKIAAAKTMLEESEISVKEISEILNFDSTSYFCRLFKNKTTFSPTEYRNSKI